VRRAVLVLVALGLASCDRAPITEVQKQVVRGFLDPDAAKFTETDTVRGNEHIYVCGLVNGKNAFGAYVGARSYWGYKDQTVVNSEIVEDGSETPCQAFHRSGSPVAADRAMRDYSDRQIRENERYLECSLHKRCLDENGLDNSM
jgi:hypothetical protein